MATLTQLHSTALGGIGKDNMHILSCRLHCLKVYLGILPLAVLMKAALVCKEKIPRVGKLKVSHASEERVRRPYRRASLTGGASKSGVGLATEVVMHLQIVTVQEASDLANF